MTQRLKWIPLFLCVVACGGSSASVAETTPAAAPAVESTVEEAAAPVAEEPQGPGQLSVGLVVDGESVEGTVRIVNSSGGRAAEGAAGSTFQLEPGEYRAYGTVTDSSILADTPERRGRDRITVLSGQLVQSDIEFGRAWVRLRVTRGSRALHRWRVELRASGSDETVLEVTPSEEYLPISAGRYSAVVHMGNTQISVDGLIFMPGARQQVPIRIQ